MIRRVRPETVIVWPPNLVTSYVSECQSSRSYLHANFLACSCVQVLLFDPLYQWTLSPLKANKLQSGESVDYVAVGGHTQNSASGASPAGTDPASMDGRAAIDSSSRKLAQRVLMRLEQKLDGVEDGVALSVSGQVAHLIQEATSEFNLCRIYPGWQQWV